MSIINPSYAYCFLAGLYIGGYTNIFSNMVITGLVTYIVKPDFYTPERIEYIKNSTLTVISPILERFKNNGTISDTVISNIK